MGNRAGYRDPKIPGHHLHPQEVPCSEGPGQWLRKLTGGSQADLSVPTPYCSCACLVSGPHPILPSALHTPHRASGAVGSLVCTGNFSS